MSITPACRRLSPRPATLQSSAIVLLDEITTFLEPEPVSSLRNIGTTQEIFFNNNDKPKLRPLVPFPILAVSW